MSPQTIRFYQNTKKNTKKIHYPAPRPPKPKEREINIQEICKTKQNKIQSPKKLVLGLELTLIQYNEKN